MDFIIKIRWNCGTERYVTGYAGRDAVSWYSDEPAYAFSTYEEARGVVLGLNINNLSGDLGGFACVVAVDDASKCINPIAKEERDNECWRLIKLQELMQKYKKEEEAC